MRGYICQKSSKKTAWKHFFGNAFFVELLYDVNTEIQGKSDLMM